MSDRLGHVGVGEDRGRPVRIVVGWLVVSVALVLGATLFPFDFHRSGEGSMWSAPLRIDVDLRSAYVFENMPTNVVLFVPFGFSLAVLARRRLSPRVALGLAAVSGVVLSLVLESAQEALLLRFASLGDVVSNGIGALAGAVLGHRFGETALARIALGPDRRPRWVARVGVASLVTLAALALTVRLDDAAAPRGWSPGYPLVVGNETSADRPWEGTLARFEIRAAPDTDRDSLASWTFGEQPAGQPPLERVGAPPARGAPDGTVLGADAWWRSIGPADAISEAIVASGGFEIALEVATASLDQSGPARIVSISDGILTRNLTIGQDGDDLALRVRSELLGRDGSDPEILVPGVFEPGTMQRIVVRFADQAVQVEVDGEAPAAYALDLGAEVAVALWSFPQSIVWMRTGSAGESAIRFAYRAVVLFPWGIALAGLMSRWDRRRWWYAGLSAVVTALGFELLLASVLAGYDLELRWVALGAVCIAAVAALFRWPAPRSEHAAPDLTPV